MNELDIIKDKKDALDTLINCYHKNIRLILDFATGIKKLNHDTLLPKHFQNDPLRIASTLKNIHKQIRKLEKERILLNLLIRKSEKEEL